MSNDINDLKNAISEIYGEQAAKDAALDPDLIALFNQYAKYNVPVEIVAKHWGKDNDLTPLEEQNLNDPQVLQQQINAGSTTAVQYEAQTNAIKNDKGDVQRESNQKQRNFERAREDAEDISVPRAEAQTEQNNTPRPRSPFDTKLTPK